MVFGLTLQTCNMFTGQGLSHDIGGGLTIAWLAVVILFFVFAFAKRWLFEEMMSAQFSLIISVAAGVIVHMIIVGMTCSPRIGLAGGLIVGAIAGYFAPSVMGEIY